MSSQETLSSCRRSDEQTLFDCFERQENGDNCCGSARTSECLQVRIIFIQAKKKYSGKRFEINIWWCFSHRHVVTYFKVRKQQRKNNDSLLSMHAMTITPIWRCWTVLERLWMSRQSKIHVNVSNAIPPFFIQSQFISLLSCRSTVLWSFSFGDLPWDMQKHPGNWWNDARDNRYVVKRWVRTTVAASATLAMLFGGQSSSNAIGRWSIANQSNWHRFG